MAKCQEYNAKSLKISQLKSQIMQLEENDKAYNALLQKYRQLQNEYQLINDAKIHLEYELKQKTETTNKILNDLKCQNMDLTNELNDKNTIFQKLTADNANLFHNLEDRKKENENFCRTVSENENMINHITQDKAQCEHDAMILNDTSKKNEENIKNLCDQLNCLKLKNQNQNDELKAKNMEINDNQRCLNEVQCDNANLNNQINLKNSALDNVQTQLNLANKSIADLTAEINAKRDEYEKGKVQLQSLQISFQNEHDNRVKAENDNMKLEGVLKDREDNLNKLNYLNEALKCDRSKLCEDKNRLMNDLERYKNHVMILTDQTNKLTDELQKIIDEDTGLYNLNNAQIQRLQKIIYENKKLLSDEIAALNVLENCVKCPPECKLERSNSDIKKTYSFQNKY
jgi:chromosome segregation ATPase